MSKVKVTIDIDSDEFTISIQRGDGASVCVQKWKSARFGRTGTVATDNASAIVAEALAVDPEDEVVEEVMNKAADIGMEVAGLL